VITLTKLRRYTFVIVTIFSGELFLGLAHRVCRAGRFEKVVNSMKMLTISNNQKRFISRFNHNKYNSIRTDSFKKKVKFEGIKELSFENSLKILQMHSKRIEEKLPEDWIDYIKYFALRLNKSNDKDSNELVQMCLLALVKDHILTKDQAIEINCLFKESNEKQKHGADLGLKETVQKSLLVWLYILAITFIIPMSCRRSKEKVLSLNEDRLGGGGPGPCG